MYVCCKISNFSIPPIGLTIMGEVTTHMTDLTSDDGKYEIYKI